MSEKDICMGRVRLTSGGKAAFRLYLPKEAGIVEKFAADELMRYIGKLSGAPIHFAEGNADGNIIAVGLRRDLMAELPGISGILPDAAAGYDGYCIAVTPDLIAIAGDNPRGVLYGVYDLLERLGCRWYFPDLDPADKEVVPPNPDLYLEAVRYAEAAKIELRIYNGSAFFFEIVPERILAQIDWAAKNRYNGIAWQPSHLPGRVQGELEEMEACGGLSEMDKRGLFLHGPCHSFQHFMSPEKYFKDHPEWFGMLDGKRRPLGGEWPLVNYCWSNEAANREFIKNVEEFVKRWPQIKILNLEWMDGSILCECRECKKKNGSDLLIDLFNRISDRLEEIAPDVTLEVVTGYGPLTEVPEDRETNGKWQGVYAHWGRNHKKSYDDPDYPRKANMLIWKTYFKNYEICSYYAAASHQPVIGAPFIHAIEGDTKFIVENGVRGTYVLQYPHGYWWNFSFILGAAGRYAYYYPKRGPVEYLRDYTVNYFGPDAGPLMGDLLLMLGANENLDISYQANNANASDDDMEWLRNIEKMIRRAEMLAKGDDLFSYRVIKFKAAFKVFLKWAQGRKMLKRVEEVFERYGRGERSEDDVRREIEAARAYTADLFSEAESVDAGYPGTLDSDWLKSWYVERILTGPVNRIEKMLEGEEVEEKSKRPDYVANLNS